MSRKRRSKKPKKLPAPSMPRAESVPTIGPSRYERPRAADLAAGVMTVAGVVLLIVNFAAYRFRRMVPASFMVGFLFVFLFAILAALGVFIHAELGARRRWRAAQPRVERAPVPKPEARPEPEPVRVRVRPVDYDATVAILGRRGRDGDAWYAELRDFKDGGYRGIALRDDTLAAIEEDEEAPADAREAAALVLRARG